MIHLESVINQLLEQHKPKSGVAKALSKTKSSLNASSHIVDAVNNFGDNLESNLGDIGGFALTAAGWLTGKATKVVGGIGGGIVAGTLKTVAGVIPDASDPKQPETDIKIAGIVDSYPLPNDNDTLLELLQWLHGHLNSNNTPYGKSAIEAMKNLHSRVYKTIAVSANENTKILKIAKSYSPKKKFGLF